MIEVAKRTLQSLVQEASSKWDSKYQLGSSGAEPDISMSRQEFDDQIASASFKDDATRMKNFPIKPKEDRKLVKLWFNCILPRLSDILSPLLGGTYTAGLVRRGNVEIWAEPCIQIESHPRAESEEQIRIRKMLTSLCEENGWHDPIEVRFSQGRIRSLKGPKEEEDTSGEQDLRRSRRLRFNHIRPSEQAEMGASLGLSCSNKVSATLGGYVLIAGCKYIATSDHPITESQKTANCDSAGDDLETVTSPSRHDLSEVEQSLKRPVLSMRNEINRLCREQNEDQDIPENNINNSPELIEAQDKLERLEILLDKVKRPKDSAIGTVKKRSMGQRKASYPKSLEYVQGLEDGTLTHQMDWCLCKAKRDNVGDNYHRYRSNNEAESHNYPEESQNTRLPGEVCHQMCEVESAAAVCYVGQGSCHREGKVNLPVLVSKDGVETHEWALMSPFGTNILYAHVAGDSGAWVIRQDNNQLMGQIHSHASGVVLFTPSRVLFDDFKEHCGVDVKLPPRAPNPVQNPVVAQQICSILRTPVAQNYDFLVSPPVASAHSKKLLIETVHPNHTLLRTSQRELGLSNTTIEQSHIPADSPIYLPSALSKSSDTQQSSSTHTRSFASSRASSAESSSNWQVTHKKLRLVSSRISLVRSKLPKPLTKTMSEKSLRDHTIALVISKLPQKVRFCLRSMSPASFRALRVVWYINNINSRTMMPC